MSPPVESRDLGQHQSPNMQYLTTAFINTVIERNAITGDEIARIKELSTEQNAQAIKLVEKMDIPELMERVEQNADKVNEITSLSLITFLCTARLDVLYAEGCLEGDLQAVPNMLYPTKLDFFLTDKGKQRAASVKDYLDQKVAVWKVLNA